MPWDSVKDACVRSGRDAERMVHLLAYVQRRLVCFCYFFCIFSKIYLYKCLVAGLMLIIFVDCPTEIVFVLILSAGIRIGI